MFQSMRDRFKAWRASCRARGCCATSSGLNFEAKRTVKSIRFAAVVAWVTILPLLLWSFGGGWALGLKAASAVIAVLTAAVTFARARKLSLTSSPSPLRHDLRAAVVFAVFFAITAIIAGNSGMQYGRIGYEVEHVTAETVVCASRFVTPGDVPAPVIEAEFNASVSYMIGNSQIWDNFNRELEQPYDAMEPQIVFKNNGTLRLGCSKIKASDIPENQAANLPFEVRGRFGEMIMGVLSRIPVPFYPLTSFATSVKNLPGDSEVNLCTPGLYYYTEGLLSIDRPDPFPVCFDPRYVVLAGSAIDTFIKSVAAFILAIVYLGLISSVAGKIHFFATAATQPVLPVPFISVKETEMIPPAYFVGDEVPLIAGDSKA